MVKFKLYDLTHPFSANSVPFMGYPSPSIKWIKRQPSDGIFAQVVITPMHVSTHIDAPAHWLGPGAKDMASIPLDRLFGPAVIADISDSVGDWYIIKPSDITSRVEVRKGDILIVKTGYHRYYYTDETRYMCMHPGPGQEFADWCIKMNFRWLGFDCPSADHPMNTHAIPKHRPDLVKEFERRMNKSLDEVFPRGSVHPMHARLFAHEIIHVENIGGDIDKLSTMRCYAGAFPWRFEGGEASICRVVAFVLED